MSRETTDILVIGGGVAGLSFALRAAEFSEVTIATKASFEDSNTWYAQGGIAAVVDPADTFEQHVQDTLTAGAGLCHEDTVRRVIGDGPALIDDLVRWGVQFAQGTDDAWDLGREGGHSARRVLHAGDLTGAAIGQALLDRVREHPRIRLLDHHFAVDLITRRRKLHAFRDACVGAYLLDTASGRITAWLAGKTVLASGGSGKVYLYTSNPDVATGDGVAMAYRIGCRVVNMEFTQFHPTCLFHPAAKNFLISEALRGEGAVLRNLDGERFMAGLHPAAELAPRDIVARAIDAEMKRTGAEHVYIDISHRDAAFVEERFPNLTEATRRYGFDLAREPVPVVPAAHYQCGGIWVDECGRSEVQDLLAIGEVAFTGLHGANRLASNSLLEGLAYARFAADALRNEAPRPPRDLDDVALGWLYGDAVSSDEAVIVTHNWDEVRRAMHSYVGIVRSRGRLQRARRRLALLAEEVQEYYWGSLPTADLLELRNLVQVAWIIVQSALRRRESRGLHFSIDEPDLLPQARDTVIDPVSHYP
jgi:L-aspartate oxidase